MSVTRHCKGKSNLCNCQQGKYNFLTSRQVRNRLGTPGVSKSFLKGAQIFQSVSNSFKLCPKRFFQGWQKVLQGWLLPLGQPECEAPQTEGALRMPLDRTPIMS